MFRFVWLFASIICLEYCFIEIVGHGVFRGLVEGPGEVTMNQNISNLEKEEEIADRYIGFRETDNGVQLLNPETGEYGEVSIPSSGMDIEPVVGWEKEDNLNRYKVYILNNDGEVDVTYFETSKFLSLVRDGEADVLGEPDEAVDAQSYYQGGIGYGRRVGMMPRSGYYPGYGSGWMNGTWGGNGSFDSNRRRDRGSEQTTFFQTNRDNTAAQDFVGSRWGNAGQYGSGWTYPGVPYRPYW